jgi:hypothetical protein
MQDETGMRHEESRITWAAAARGMRMGSISWGKMGKVGKNKQEHAPMRTAIDPVGEWPALAKEGRRMAERGKSQAARGNESNPSANTEKQVRCSRTINERSRSSVRGSSIRG